MQLGRVRALNPNTARRFQSLCAGLHSAEPVERVTTLQRLAPRLHISWILISRQKNFLIIMCGPVELALNQFTDYWDPDPILTFRLSDIQIWQCLPAGTSHRSQLGTQKQNQHTDSIPALGLETNRTIKEKKRNCPCSWSAWTLNLN